MDVGLLEPGTRLSGRADARHFASVIADDLGMEAQGIRYAGPDEAAAAVTDGLVVDGWHFWHVDGLGQLAELAELLDTSA